MDLGTPKQSLDLLNQLKTLYKTKAKKAKVDVSKQAHIIMYPKVPTEAMIRDCYDADDPPVASVSSSYGTLECLRRSSNKSKAEQTALVPTMPGPAMQPPAMQPPAMPGFAPNAMQNAQQAMAFMGMDPMQAMMAMAARFFSQQGGQLSQQSQQDPTPGLRIFAGSRGEANLVSSPTPQAPQAVTPQETGDDSQEQLALALPAVISPEDQAAAVAMATKARQEAKAEMPKAKAEPKSNAKAKGKSTAKAKAKSNAKDKAKSKPKAKSQGKIEKGSKRKASDGDDEDDDVAPSPKAKATPSSPMAKAKPGAKAKARAERTVFTEDNKPPVPEPKSGTTWYRKGKIHRNQGGFRVFLNASDRCDKKVRITDENNCEAEWQKALKMIDDSYDGIPDAD